jgi:hypothetical protein
MYSRSWPKSQVGFGDNCHESGRPIGSKSGLPERQLNGGMPSNHIFELILIFHHRKDKKYIRPRSRRKFLVAIRDNHQI